MDEDIYIELKFCGRKYFPADLIERIIQIVDQAIYSAEIQELDEIRNKFKEIPDDFYEIAKNKLEEYRSGYFLVGNISSGSLIVVGTIAAVLLWIFKITFGETIKQAWLESDWHNEIKNILLNNRQDKIKSIVNSIKNRIKMSTRKKMDLAEVKIHTEELNEAGKIIIQIILREDGGISPPRSELHNLLK